jgi:hypothetical protein
MSFVYARRDFVLEQRGELRGVAELRERIRKEGGRLFGLFRGQIGLGVLEGVLVTAWADERAAARAEADAFALLPGVRSSRLERFVPTARPAEPERASHDGIFAFRTFEVRAADVGEFVSLSEQAWPAFEGTYDARIQGLWRSLDVAPPDARMWLLTRYASLAEWERSREGTGEPHFRRRHQLTLDTRVVTAVLIEP